MGTGTGLALYMVKYTLTGIAILIGPARDKLAAAAIEVDLSSIPEGTHHHFIHFNTSINMVEVCISVCLISV